MDSTPSPVPYRVKQKTKRRGSEFYLESSWTERTEKTDKNKSRPIRRKGGTPEEGEGQPQTETELIYLPK